MVKPSGVCWSVCADAVTRAESALPVTAGPLRSLVVLEDIPTTHPSRTDGANLGRQARISFDSSIPG